MATRHSLTLVAGLLAFVLGAAPVGAQEEAEPEPEPEWAGSFGVADSETRFKLAGFAEFDFIYDSDEIATRCQFVTSTIATDRGDSAGSSEGRTSYCVNATRLTLESRTPTKLGRLTTFVSIDLFGDPNKPSLRMRQAYGELEGVLLGGDLLAGQAWSTFTDRAAWPDMLDFEGPSSSISSRRPQLRWSKQVSGSIETRLAAEAPSGRIDGADATSRWPDFVARTRFTHAHGYVQGAGILRDVRATFEDNPATGALGWGLAASGSVVFPALIGTGDAILFEVSYGEGTGGYYDDAPPNAVYDPDSGQLEPLPVLGYYVAYEHTWTDTLSSGLLYSWIGVDNLDAQPADALHEGAYLSANLIWRPDTPLKFGVEFLRGGTRDKDGAKGSDNRVQASAQFSF